MVNKHIHNIPHDHSIMLNLKSDIEFYGSFEDIHTPHVVVSLGRTASSIHSMLSKKNVPVDNIHIIDTLTNQLSAEKVHNTTYLYNNRNLTDLSAAIEGKLRQLPPSKKTLVFDSVSKLAHIHSPSVALGFVRFLNSRLKDFNTRVIFLTDKKNPLNDELSSIVDGVINL